MNLNSNSRKKMEEITSSSPPSMSINNASNPAPYDFKINSKEIVCICVKFFFFQTIALCLD